MCIRVCVYVYVYVCVYVLVYLYVCIYADALLSFYVNIGPCACYDDIAITITITFIYTYAHSSHPLSFDVSLAHILSLSFSLSFYLKHEC